MSLATRCTSCGTVFRVVQDQLRVSSGWVRCGRCSEVFNAIESLVDLELDRPGDGAPTSVHGARVMEELARVAGAPDSGPTYPQAPAPPPPDPDPAPDVEPAVDQGVNLVTGQGEVVGTDEARLSRLDAEPDETPMRPPAFVRQAERAARWRSPAVRAALAGLALLAGTGLAWQVHLSQHDWLVARWPALHPAVERLCGWSGCVIEPPRHVESLAVESSGLVRAGAVGTYRLTAVLRNRDRLALRTPAIDLTLTDAQGRVIARRVFDAAELGAPQASIVAGGELALSATLRSRDAPVVGYTIEIFYP